MEDLDIVYSATFDARSKWYDIGLALNLDPSSLDVIRGENPGNTSSCLRSMLVVWLRTAEPKPSWAGLKAALISPPVNEEQLISKFPSNYSVLLSAHVVHQLVHYGAPPL